MGLAGINWGKWGLSDIGYWVGCQNSLILRGAVGMSRG